MGGMINAALQKIFMHMIIDKYTLTGYLRYLILQMLYFLMPLIIILFSTRSLENYWGTLLSIPFIIFFFTNKKNHEVSKVEINFSKKTVNVFYYKYFKKNCIKIDFKNYNLNYKLRKYGAGNVMMALLFINNNKIVAEISVKNCFGWSETDFKDILKTSKEIKGDIPG